MTYNFEIVGFCELILGSQNSFIKMERREYCLIDRETSRSSHGILKLKGAYKKRGIYEKHRNHRKFYK